MKQDRVRTAAAAVVDSVVDVVAAVVAAADAAADAAVDVTKVEYFDNQPVNTKRLQECEIQPEAFCLDYMRRAAI